MAKDLVRTRKYIQKFYGMRTQLQAVGLRIQVSSCNGNNINNKRRKIIIIKADNCIFFLLSSSFCFLLKTMRSNQAMADAMKGVTKVFFSSYFPFPFASLVFTVGLIAVVCV
jgi:NADH:ubiquinone oxidoreductase subunit 6 (subunit J)